MEKQSKDMATITFLSAPAIYNNYAFVKFYYFIPDEENNYFYAIYFKKVKNKWVKID